MLSLMRLMNSSMNPSPYCMLTQQLPAMAAMPPDDGGGSIVASASPRRFGLPPVMRRNWRFGGTGVGSAEEEEDEEDSRAGGGSVLPPPPPPRKELGWLLLRPLLLVPYCTPQIGSTAVGAGCDEQDVDQARIFAFASFRPRRCSCSPRA